MADSDMATTIEGLEVHLDEVAGQTRRHAGHEEQSQVALDLVGVGAEVGGGVLESYLAAGEEVGNQRQQACHLVGSGVAGLGGHGWASPGRATARSRVTTSSATAQSDAPAGSSATDRSKAT